MVSVLSTVQRNGAVEAAESVDAVGRGLLGGVASETGGGGVTIGERISTLRHERGWTLHDLSNEVDRVTGHKVSLSYLSSLERGVQVGPSIVIVARIAAAFDLTLVQFLQVVLVLVRKGEVVASETGGKR